MSPPIVAVNRDVTLLPWDFDTMEIVDLSKPAKLLLCEFGIVTVC